MFHIYEQRNHELTIARPSARDRNGYRYQILELSAAVGKASIRWHPGHPHRRYHNVGILSDYRRRLSRLRSAWIGGARMILNKIILAALIILIAFAVDEANARGRGGGGFHSGGGKSVYVHGYTRRDGTYVRPYYRSPPGGSSSIPSGRGYFPLSPVESLPAPSSSPATASAAPPSSAPSAPQVFALGALPTPKIDDCPTRGWCYIALNPDGGWEAHARPITDVSYPPPPGVTLPRMIIVNTQ